MQALVEKMSSSDKDFRYMACNDLLAEIKKGDFKVNERLERKVAITMPSVIHRVVDWATAPSVARCEWRSSELSSQMVSFSRLILSGSLVAFLPSLAPSSRT